MSSGVVVTPDQVSIGVLVSSIPRDVIDVAVAAGVFVIGFQRQDRRFEQSRRFPPQDLHDGIIPDRHRVAQAVAAGPW